MGVKDLFKVITPTKIHPNLNGFRGKYFAIDALGELHRAIKGGKSLTNEEGKFTHHFRHLLNQIVLFESMGIQQHWVFDFDNTKDTENTHFMYKGNELAQRQARISKQKAQLSDLKQNREWQLSITEQLHTLDEIAQQEAKQLLDSMQPMHEIEQKIEVLDRRSKHVGHEMIHEFQSILNMLGIVWSEAPITYEGEHIACCMTRSGEADYVYSVDSDTLVYNPKRIIKRVSTKALTKNGKPKTVIQYYEYDMDEIYKRYNISHADMVKIAVCLGPENGTTITNDDGTTQHIKKIKGIGPETVLSKFKTVPDTEYAKFQSVFDRYMRQCDKPIVFNNFSSMRFTTQQIKDISKWLIEKQKYQQKTVDSIFKSLPQPKAYDLSIASLLKL